MEKLSLQRLIDEEGTISAGTDFFDILPNRKRAGDLKADASRELKDKNQMARPRDADIIRKVYEKLVKRMKGEKRTVSRVVFDELDDLPIDIQFTAIQNITDNGFEVRGAILELAKTYADKKIRKMLKQQKKEKRRAEEDGYLADKSAVHTVRKPETKADPDESVIATGTPAGNHGMYL